MTDARRAATVRDRRDRHRHQALDRPQPRRARRDGRAAPVHRDAPTSCSPRDPDAVFLANGPGDPAALDYVVDTLRELVGKRPVFGICLGHQLLCRAVGLETFKLPVRPPRRQPPGQGPRDRPDRDHLAEPRLRGRSGPAAARDDRRRRAGALGDRLRRRRSSRHVNLYDRTVEGLTLLDVPGGDGPVPPRGRARARTTRCTSSTASSTRSRAAA